MNQPARNIVPANFRVIKSYGDSKTRFCFYRRFYSSKKTIFSIIPYRIPPSRLRWRDGVNSNFAGKLNVKHIWNGRYSSTEKAIGSVGGVGDWVTFIEQSNSLFYMFVYSNGVKIIVTRCREDGFFAGSTQTLGYNQTTEENLVACRYRTYGYGSLLIDPSNRGAYGEDGTECVLTDIYDFYF